MDRLDAYLCIPFSIVSPLPKNWTKVLYFYYDRKGPNFVGGGWCQSAGGHAAREARSTSGQFHEGQPYEATERK